MYPKDRLPRTKTQMPANLVTLFAHVMGRANEGSRGAASQNWDEVLQPPSSPGSNPSGSPFPMSTQDWRKAEAFNLHLTSLMSARHNLCTSNGSGRGGTGHSNSNGNPSSCSSFFTPSAAAASSGGGHTGATQRNAQVSPANNSSSGKSILHANGKMKNKTKPVTILQSSQTGTSPAEAAACAATPDPATAWPCHQAPRVTPKEPLRAGEPSAPIKAAGRVAASRRVNGGADHAVASLAVSRAGPGAFETPSHSSHQLVPPGAQTGSSSRGREHSPSRYPARLRSRRFPQLGGSGESPEPPQPRGFGHGPGAEAVDEGDQTQGARRLSPRHSSQGPLGVRGQGKGLSSDHQHPHDWLGVVAEEREVSAQLNHGDGEGGNQFYGRRTRTAPKAAHDLVAAAAASPLGAFTPQMGIGSNGSPLAIMDSQVPPPIVAQATAADPSPRVELAVPARPRQVLQGGRSSTRAPPIVRSSVGGRNYTDNHVKQLTLIEAVVVANATAKDRVTYNLPRQGRTLTLTNVFKFVALRGSGAMYSLAMEKQVEEHTGRHSNFFDGKIDARIVNVIKRDICDEAITKSRKFSKILLSLVAEGCTHSDCDWDHTSFTSEKIATMQANLEAETGSSALVECTDFLPPGTAGAAASTSSTLGPRPFTNGGDIFSAPANGALSKRRLDLGRDDGGKTPSPRLKKLKRAARARLSGIESTPTGDTIGNSKSPPKEEDDMRAAEVLQGLKGVGGPTG